MVFGNIREELHSVHLNRAAHACSQLTYQCGEVSYIRSQVHDFLSHRCTGIAYACGTVQGEGDACINHVLAVAEGSAYAQHNLFIRTVECAYRSSVFALVVAVACCKGQFVIGIEIHRVQRCESGGTGANLVNAVAEIVNTMIEFIKMLSEFCMLSIILYLACDIFNRQSAYFFIGVAVFYYQSSGSGFRISRNFSQLCILQLAFQLNILAVSYFKSDFAVCTDAAAVNELILRLNGLNQLAFIKCYGVVMIAVSIHCVGYSDITFTIIRYGSNGVGVVFFDGVNELSFIKAYSVFVVTVCINSFSNIYITIAIVLRGSNSVSIILLNKIAQLVAINAKLICMVAVFTIIFNRQDIGIYSNGSNGISILGVFLNEALQSIFINTNYIILIIQTATAYAVIYSNDSMTGFCSSNSIGIIFLNGLDELIFVNTYGIIIITVIINHFGNIYITVAVSLRSSNGIGIILLYKIT